MAFTGSVFGSGTGPAIYSDFSCGGWEDKLSDCNKNVYPNLFCTSDQIAGALCTSVCEDGDVRLVGGQNSHEGTVEICFNSIWGMVSDLNWGNSDALVVCRQLSLGTDGKSNNLYKFSCSHTSDLIPPYTHTSIPILALILSFLYSF